jgi:hypothetical protein
MVDGGVPFHMLSALSFRGTEAQDALGSILLRNGGAGCPFLHRSDEESRLAPDSRVALPRFLVCST